MTDYAKIAYEGYRKQSGGVSLISGQTIPPYEELLPPIQAAWAAAAAAVLIAKAEETMKSKDTEVPICVV